MSDEPPRRPDLDTSDTDPTADPAHDGMPYSVLRRYISGASDAAEARRVMAWAAESTRRQGYLAALRRTWASGPSVADAEHTESAWAALRVQLDVPASDAVPPFVAPWEQPVIAVDVRRRSPARLLTHAFDTGRRRAVAPIAAAMLLVAGGALWLTDSLGKQSSGRSAPGPVREIVTGPGQRASVNLGDGSVVTLAGGTRLRVPVDFGARRRQVVLEGQAYFEVIHDTSRPFIVSARGTQTMDIGTAFVLRAYPEEPRVQVVVVEGEIAFGRDQASGPAAVQLTQGRLGQLAQGAPTPTVREVDPSIYTGWLTGRLVFDNAPLADVAAELRRWYDVDIRFADPSLAQETFTAKFTAESLSETLRTLTTVLHLEAERSGKTVVLRRQ